MSATSKATEATAKLSTNNLLLVMVLISLLVVGVAALATKSLVTTAVRDTKVLQKKNAAEKQLKEDTANAPQLVSAYQALGDQAGLIADALPTTIDFPSLMVTFENMALTSGERLKNISPVVSATGEAPASADATSTDTPLPQPYQFTISVGGDYPGLLRLLNTIETSARPMRIIDGKFTGAGSALNGDLTIETYYQDKAALPFSTETVK